MRTRGRNPGFRDGREGVAGGVIFCTVHPCCRVIRTRVDTAKPVPESAVCIVTVLPLNHRTVTGNHTAEEVSR